MMRANAVATHADHRADRAGFSLMEAMIVLLVAGMALSLLFSIAGRAAQIGFGLGGRALAVADQALAEDSLREAMRALLIPPTSTRDPREGLFLTPIGLVGQARGFEGAALFDRPTLCAERGPVSSLALRLEGRGRGDVVLCRVGKTERVLMDLGDRTGRFAYSADGRYWSDRWPLKALERDVRPRPQNVYVRLVTNDGAYDITEQARTSYAATTAPPALLKPRTEELQ